jgi:hypothetical protein
MKDSAPSKTILIILALAVIAVIGFVIYSHRAKGVLDQPVVTENTPVPNPAEWPSSKVSEQRVTDKGSYYTINAVYPVVKDDNITAYFKTFVDNAVSEFKNDTSWAAGSGANVAPAEAASLSLTITYTEHKTITADNFIFSNTSYSGGAHGLESTKTFSFSATGQMITTASLFSNGDVGLQTIAPYVKQQLMASLPSGDQAFIADGTAPTDDNYANFTIENDGIIFIFDPYQVAPYSDGQQTVKVPYSVFKSIANTKLFPVGTKATQ